MERGWAYVNGKFCSIEDAKISVFDQGFTHSDAVYDVTSVWKGMFFRLDEHIERFLTSCRGWNIPMTLGSAELKKVLATCVSAGNVSDGAYVAIVATRGGYADEEAKRQRDITRPRPTVIAYAVPYAWIFDRAHQDRGVKLIVAKTPRIPDACINTRYKNYHWGDLTQGKFEARAAGADAAVHLTIDGFLTEGAGFNIFFTKNGRLFTPARNVLHGVTRSSAIELATELGIPVEVGDFTVEEFRACDEAFATSTAGGIMPIAEVDGRLFNADGKPGPLSIRLRELYWERREAGWCGTPVDAASIGF